MRISDWSSDVCSSDLADSSPIPTASPFHGAVQRPLIQRDLDAARALAKAAGYKGDTIRLAPSHSPPEMYDAAILIQEMARAAGLNNAVEKIGMATGGERVCGDAETRGVDGRERNKERDI